MSRTRKGSKGPGYEWWGKRPFTCHTPTSLLKKLTHRIERKQGKRETTELVTDTIVEIDNEVG